MKKDKDQITLQDRGICIERAVYSVMWLTKDRDEAIVKLADDVLEVLNAIHRLDQRSRRRKAKVKE
jgi:hypothetical protein